MHSVSSGMFYSQLEFKPCWVCAGLLLLFIALCHGFALSWYELETWTWPSNRKVFMQVLQKKYSPTRPDGGPIINGQKEKPLKCQAPPHWEFDWLGIWHSYATPLLNRKASWTRCVTFIFNSGCECHLSHIGSWLKFSLSILIKLCNHPSLSLGHTNQVLFTFN